MSNMDVFVRKLPCPARALGPPFYQQRKRLALFHLKGSEIPL